MKNYYPFYYRVDVSYLHYKSPDDADLYIRKEEFRNSDLLKARVDAFNFFDNYLAAKGEKGNDGYLFPVDGNLCIGQKKNFDSKFDKSLPMYRYSEDEQQSIYIEKVSISIVSSEGWGEILSNIEGSDGDFYYIDGDFNSILYPEFDFERERARRESYEKVRLEKYSDEYDDRELIEDVLGFSPNRDYSPRQIDEIIHQVTSFPPSSWDEQRMLDNLTDEYNWFGFFKIDTTSLVEKVTHYGVDYAESGEAEPYLPVRILHTPHVWASFELYCKRKDLKDLKVPNKSRLQLPEPKVDSSQPHFHSFETEEQRYKRIIEEGEGYKVEFKPSLLYHFTVKKLSYVPQDNVVKTICAFLNSDGGFLFVGVGNDGSINGLEEDFQLLLGKDLRSAQDKLLVKFDNIMNDYGLNNTCPVAKRVEIDGKHLLIIEVFPSRTPVYIKTSTYVQNRKSKNIDGFYIRKSASTIRLETDKEINDFIKNRKRS